VPAMSQVSHAAIVSRSDPSPGRLGPYLQLTAAGDPHWTENLEAATAFDSMREAMRAATRLPSALRAYGLPRHAELLAAQYLH
jgi:hypothetical protein